MKVITVTGGGDDNIEIEVDGQIVEEILTYDHARLAFDDGTVLTANFGQGWRIDRVEAGTAEVHIERAPVSGLDRDYTDRVTITGDLKVLEAHIGRGTLKVDL